MKNLLFWWRLTGFLITAIDPSPTLRMTSYHPSSFWAGVRISCEKDGKQQYDTERRIYLLLWRLTGFSVMVMDSWLAFRMTFWHGWHFTGRQKAVGIPAGIYRPLASKMKESLKIMKIKWLVVKWNRTHKKTSRKTCSKMNLTNISTERGILHVSTAF